MTMNQRLLQSVTALAIRPLCACACLLIVVPEGPLAQTREEIKRVQQALVAYGVARTDGVLDQSTRLAIKAYQRDWQLADTGDVSEELLERLSRKHSATKPQWRPVANQNCTVWSARPGPRELITWHGGCVDGRASGHGTLRMSWALLGRTMHIEFDGDYRNGRADGRGRMVYATGDRYAGHFKHGHRDGLGRYQWSNGTEYWGYFEQGYRHGNGVATFTNGDRYAGRWRRGKPHGDGLYIPAGGEAEEREWSNGCSTLLGRNRWLFTTRASCGF